MLMLASVVGCAKDNPVYGLSESGAGSNSTSAASSTGVTSSGSASTSSPTGPSSSTSVGATSGPGDPSSSTGSLQENLVVWYRFEGGPVGIVPDDGPNGLDATCQQCPTPGPGHVGQAGVFDGTGTDLASPEVSAFDLESFTLSAWVRMDQAPATGNYMQIFGKQLGTVNRNSYELWIKDTTPGVRPFFTVDDGVDQTSVSVMGVDLLGTWRHLAGTFDGVQACVFVDGVPGQCVAASVSHTSNPVRIGHDANGGSFHGAIDEVRIYDRALSPDEIQTLFESG
jgi:hypothetical protein